MDDERIDIWIRLREAQRYIRDTLAAAGATKVLNRELDKTRGSAARSAAGTKLLSKTIALVKPAALITGLGVLSQVMSASAAGGIGLASALSPLAGLLGALPGAALLGAQGLGVLALGLTGVMKAVGGLNAQMDPKKFAQLQRPAQDFALTLDALKRPVLELQRRIQAGLFPGLTKGLHEAQPAIAALTKPLVLTAQVFGRLGERLGALVGSRGFLADLRSQAYFNAVQIERLGGGGLHLIRVLRALAVTSRPLIADLVHMVTGWAQTADHMATTGRRTGALNRFFGQTRKVVHELVSIGGDLAVTLFHIARIGKRELGDSLLHSLVLGAHSLREWSGSAKGIRQITGYFRDAKPVVYAVARLFGQLAQSFLGFGAGGPGTAALIDKLTALVPVLANVVSQTSNAFGPAFFDAISNVAKAFAPLAGASGPLVLFVTTIGQLAKLVLTLEQHVPGVTTALSALLGVMAVGRVVRMTTAMFGLAGALDAVAAGETAAGASGAAGKGGLLRLLGKTAKYWGPAALITGGVLEGNHLIDKYVKDGTHAPRTHAERQRARTITHGDPGAGNAMVLRRRPTVVGQLVGWMGITIDSALQGPRPPRVAPVARGTAGGTPGRETHIQLHSQLVLPDGRVIAEATDQVVANDHARS